jgi:hypothetical protein
MLILLGLGTMGDAGFPECQMHSGKAPKHSGKASPSATLGVSEEDIFLSWGHRPMAE